MPFKYSERSILKVTGFMLFFSVCAANSGIGEGGKHVERIFVNKGTFTLTLVRDNAIVAVYPVAIGRGVRGWPSTPEGNFVIENKSTLGCRKRCGPYGTRFMGLNPSHVGIHGTNEPHKIGTPASHGCIRMLNDDVELLFEKVGVGAKVTILNKKAVIVHVRKDDKNMSLKCLPLTPDTLGYCTVKPLVGFVGGAFEESVERKYKNKLAIRLSEDEKFLFAAGKNEAVDEKGNAISLTAPILYKKGEFYALMDDVLSFFKLKSTLEARPEDEKINKQFTAWIEPFDSHAGKENNDRNDVPREPFTQMMSLK